MANQSRITYLACRTNCPTDSEEVIQIPNRHPTGQVGLPKSFDPFKLMFVP